MQRCITPPARPAPTPDPRLATSLTRRTPAHIAIGATLCVAWSGAVIYFRMYQEIRQRVLEQLSLYTLQRSQSEATLFALARDMPQIVKRAFLRQ